ncbi:MAG: hypothetical protein JSW11_18030 [Candidatus Heimdallarchaeota archaeon]|nr:MAG: hypothetical protein JSW11_18030 [Candidatus Heimdallarchaeota archaeon]
MIESLVKSIVEAMYERENAKKKMRIHHGSSNDLDIIISATDYYIRANLWILQSLGVIQSNEICI